MDDKINQRFLKINNTIKKQREEYIDVFNATHQKIEIGDEQLYNMIKQQREIIEALITILIKNDIVKSATEIGDTINAKEVMEALTKIEPTEREIKSMLQAEADILYKLLYRSKE